MRGHSLRVGHSQLEQEGWPMGLGANRATSFVGWMTASWVDILEAG